LVTLAVARSKRHSVADSHNDLLEHQMGGNLEVAEVQVV
jgi:hypothetical protein